MDRIILKEMTFYGYHGVYPEEKKLGQKFKVDLIIGLDLQPAAQHDNLTLTIDYGAVYAKIKAIVENERYNLVETLAEQIARCVLGFANVAEVTVRLWKPEAPIPWASGMVGVEITRRRND